MDLASPRYGILGLMLFVLGIIMTGWTPYLLAGIIVILIGFTLMFTSGHYHFRKVESRSATKDLV